MSDASATLRIACETCGRINCTASHAPEPDGGPAFPNEEQTYRALAMRVLAVAHTRVEGTWAAYCDAVPGMNHDREQDAVLKTGDKLSETVARALFPRFEKLPYAH